MTDQAPKKSKPEPKCASCGLPVVPLSSGVALYGRTGVTYEHQACWQSRTFGERHD